MTSHRRPDTRPRRWPERPARPGKCPCGGAEVQRSGDSIGHPELESAKVCDRCGLIRGWVTK